MIVNLQQSKAAIKGKQYSVSVEMCTEALSMLGVHHDQGLRARLYNNRGLAQHFLGHSAAALFDCCMAVEIRPDMWQHHYSRHMVFEAIGEYKAANVVR